MSWIDELGYPWHLEVAQQLHINLLKYKPAKQMALLLAAKAEVDTSLIDPDQAPFFVWKDILDQASQEQMLRPFIKQVLKQTREDHSIYKFLTGILDTGEGEIEAERVNEDGSANFISGDDSVTEQEALLFKEDLTLPIGKLASLITTLQKLEILAPAVCRLIISIHDSGQTGTGFRIGTKTLLTNHHVLHSKHTGEQATAVTAQFGFDDDGAGGIVNGQLFKCAPASIVSDQQNDWGVITCSEDLPNTIPIIDLTKAVPPVMRTQAFIIQHPQYGTKKIGYVRNSILNINDRVVHYLTDTQEGSSGAPVFNAEGQLIAVHRAGGLPVELTGMTPMKNNEGVLIKKILEGFAAQGVQVV